MESYLEGLIKAQADAAARINEIIDRAEEEKRALTPEDNTNLEAANAAYDKAKADADFVAGAADRVKASAQARAILAPAVQAMEEDKDVARLELGPDGWIARSWLDVQSGQPSKTLMSTVHVPLGVEARALSVGSQGAGTTFPISFIDTVHMYERTLNPMIDVATVLNRTTGAPVQVPTVTADVTAGGSVTAEAGGITEGDPTLSTPQINTFKIAHTVLYSAELDQDNVVGLDSLLARLVTRPIGIGWGSFFTHGTGTTQPWGFLQRAGNGGTAAGTADYGAGGKYIGWGDAVSLQFALASPYRKAGSFMTNSMARIRQWRDSNNAPVFQPSLTAGMPDTLLGNPIYENPAMVAAGSANTALAFGDFSQYYVVNVSPVRIDISRDYKFNTDQLALRVVTRRGGDLIDTAAVKFLVSQAV